MELTCEELVEVITAYIEGAMSTEERARFDDHLDICEGCRNYLEQMRATIRAIGYLREQHIPAAARDPLLAAFRTWQRGA